MNAIKRIEKTLDFLEESFRKKALSLFGQLLEKELPVQILRTMRQAKEEPGKMEEILSGFEMPGRKRYIALFERYIQELFIQGMNLGIKEIDAKREAIRSKRVGFAVEVTGDPVLPVNAVKWMDSWVDTFGNDYYDDVTKDVVRVMKNALEAGYSVPDVMDGLKQYLTGEQYTKARLEVIARTNATTAFNQGRLETFRQNAGFVRAVRYSSILDTRTTLICRSRHGKIMLLDSEELAANTPPLHYQCRSILLPVDRFDWEDMQGSPKLKEKLDWTKWKDENGQIQDVPPPGKGFGNVGNALKNKETQLLSGKEMNETGYDLPKPKQPTKSDIVSALDRFGVEKSLIKDISEIDDISTMENRAVTAIMDVMRQKFSSVPDYKILADKWNVSGIEFVEMGKSLMGEFLINEGKINLNYKFKESILMTLNPSKPVDSIEMYALYTNLHESIHSIESGKYFSGTGETLEEAITGSLSRMWLKDFLRINGLQASDRFINTQTPFYGYYDGYSALKSLVEYLPGTGFRQYCLQLKLAKTTEARIAKLKTDYKEYIALRSGVKSSELPDTVDEILNDFGKNELYSKPGYVKIFIGKVNSLIEEIVR